MIRTSANRSLRRRRFVTNASQVRAVAVDRFALNPLDGARLLATGGRDPVRRYCDTHKFSIIDSTVLLLLHARLLAVKPKPSCRAPGERRLIDILGSFAFRFIHHHHHHRPIACQQRPSGGRTVHRPATGSQQIHDEIDHIRTGRSDTEHGQRALSGRGQERYLLLPR